MNFSDLLPLIETQNKRSQCMRHRKNALGVMMAATAGMTIGLAAGLMMDPENREKAKKIPKNMKEKSKQAVKSVMDSVSNMSKDYDNDDDTFGYMEDRAEAVIDNIESEYDNAEQKFEGTYNSFSDDSAQSQDVE